MYEVVNTSLWIINPFDDIPGEGQAQRYWSLAEKLRERGHAVVWWSSEFSHRRKAARKLDEDAGGLNVRLVKVPPYRRNLGLRRVWNHRCYGRNLYRDASQAVEKGELLKPDLIVASLPPMEGPIAALRLRDRFGCRVVTDIMDAWPDTLLQAFPNNPVARAVGKTLLYPYARMLRRACAEADGVSAQSHAFADFARTHGATGDVHVCYLGSEPVSRAGESTSRPRTILRLIYLGAMGRSYDLETLLDAVELVRSERLEVELVLVGDGEKRETLERRKVNGVRFAGYLTGEQLEHELRSADLGVIPMFRESGVTVPYKAGDYLAYGLPLLSSLDGELGELIRAHQCGEVYNPGDPESLARLIQDYAENPDRVKQESENALVCFDGRFNRTKTYPAFADWLEEIAGR